MNRNNIAPYFLTDENEQRLWQDAIFVFDTSSLLQFYYYSRESQHEIFTTFEKISKRLWLPNHVEFEYLKNRKSTLLKPIGEKYNALKEGQKEGQLTKITSSIKDVKKRLNILQQETSKQDRHPYLNEAIMREFEATFDKFEEQFQGFREQIDDEIEKRVTEIKSFSTNDSVLDAFEKYFDIGREYTFPELMNIVKEGELRYKFDIPPGYEDHRGANKKAGLQIFGDLIIWKQILEQSEKTNQPIILVTHDTKPDWCYVVRENGEKRIERPREELIKELKDTSGKMFWMYTLSQFLYKANRLIQANVSEDVIQEISSFVEYENVPHIEVHGSFMLKCRNCNTDFIFPNDQMDLDFQIVDIQERNMGAEVAYESAEDTECPICHANISIINKVWEYPVGINNYEEFESEGAEILREPRVVINAM